MQKIKQLKGYGIFELSAKEMADRNSTSAIHIFTKEEMQQPRFTWNTEWEVDSVTEAEQWILGDDFVGLQAHEIAEIEAINEDNDDAMWAYCAEGDRISADAERDYLNGECSIGGHYYD